LFWQLLPSYIVLLVATVTLLVFVAVRTVRDFGTSQARVELLSRARLTAPHFQALLKDASTRAGIDGLCKQLGSESATRITVIWPDGVVAGDSHESPAAMENHADRPEIRDGLAMGEGTSVRYSATLHRTMIYAAVPLRDGGRNEATVRVAVPLEQIERMLDHSTSRMIAAGAAIVVLAGLLSYYWSRRLISPIEQMTAVAEHFAQGDFNRRVRVPDSRELARLADALNWMASQLDEKIDTVRQQQYEAGAVLSSMVEGVMVVDSDEQIINLNAAAGKLLETDVSTAPGRSIQEVVRNLDLQMFISRVLRTEAPVEADIVLYQEQEKYIQAHGAKLRDARGDPVGALVVMHDVTKLRRLENLRRDFVANVSHELKTPITTIKGFVETLLDGAAQDPEKARRFLQITAKHAERLTMIIEDLLSLSRLEQHNGKSGIALARTRLKDVIDTAVETCHHKAEARRIRVTVECPEDLSAEINAPLVEQALVNLVDNAVKYSDPGGDVLVKASAGESGVRIHVVDHGSGIQAEHLPRLFERFYRVDKARSREMGGTGLGLAIVKHIAQAHRGSVRVQSEPGRGSTFTLDLPGDTPA